MKSRQSPVDGGFWERHPVASALIRAFFSGEWVTRTFGWFYMMVSRFAGPAMTIAVGYLIVYAIDTHNSLASMPKDPNQWDEIASFASGFINVTPELVFPGTVVLSIYAFVQKRWVHGVLNAIASVAFATLTLVLLHAFTTNGINDQFLGAMLLWRAVSALFYTVVAEVCSHGQADVHTVKTVDVLTRMEEIGEQVNAQVNTFASNMSQQVNTQVNALASQVNTQVNVYLDQVNASLLQLGEQVNVHQRQLIPQQDDVFTSVQVHVDQRFQELRAEMFQQIEDLARLMDNLNNGVTQVSRTMREVKVSVSEVTQRQTLVQAQSRPELPPVSEKSTKLLKQRAESVVNANQKLSEVPSLEVSGVPPDVVNRILTDRIVNGISWRNISGNYIKSIKPVKDAYELYVLEMSALTGSETGPISVVDTTLVNTEVNA